MPVSKAYRPDPRHPSLGGEFYDVVAPADFPEATLRFRNDRWAARVGLDTLTDEEWVRHFARFEPLPGNIAQPLALRYHGHQFRSYNPDLGDGRGFLFAQMRDAADGRLLDLGTKGSGRTPWSRTADGRLTLKGGVREILATEMLEAQGVYTSKTFSLIETGEDLVRHDEPSPTRSAVMVRLSHSHVRIGTFQRLAALEQQADIKRLVDYCIEHYWSQAADAPDPVAAFFTLAVEAIARMGADWWVAGFVHGVLNTDNTTITGESFDYGPWRFLPTLDPAFTAAYFDHSGLYAFGRQAPALFWNCERLAGCLLDLSTQAELVKGLEAFQPAFWSRLEARTHAKLGLVPGAGARELVQDFYEALSKSQLPYERAFFDLVGGAMPERIAASPHRDAYAGEHWSGIMPRLRAGQPSSSAAAALAHPYFGGSAPCTILIDEMEATWAPIAENDDWFMLHRKIADIRDQGAALAPLFEPGGQGFIPQY
ncbi:protein adenylyltransferase SelO [Emcibacter sp. SYSU 3D8]|uniref:protein adenylyltransferase SelO n=1 Tax=Emcibacter sp. SYSU 3D8 TaxID=3133969 RepID=UPI0031FE9291